MADPLELSQPEAGDPREAARVRLLRKVALMVEHVEAIDALLHDLLAALESPGAPVFGQPQLKALQDISEILRECQQLAFSNASELIHEMDEHSSDTHGASSDDE